MSKSISTELLVLGSGPGGYSAAFRAADLGLKVVLLERYAEIGGVCLNVGCIPSKALLHVAKVIDDAKDMSAHGLGFGQPKFDYAKIRDYKSGVVKKLTGGLKMMAKQRKVDIVTGYGKFISSTAMEVTQGDEVTTVNFKDCIIAA